ncbi:hypothetical protein [Candidatus Pantoea edessiphila]|uniref:hypothetical protein n=1 Tax=Candidatus Pantoea edessiphila TaxID=2044610 RepID=UPI00109C1FE4|nr:hypothetical protein [Candidatus Pantoea edessiphila]MBK4775450.1 hypothetical protein [Pantoea sp. Edef]
MKIGDYVTIKCECNYNDTGRIIAIETFNKKPMYLIILEDYPIGVWFFNEGNIIKK